MSAEPLIRILFVEDVAVDAELEQRELRRQDLVFEAMRVETEADFLKALDEFRPDLVISDYSLPQFDGMRALQLTLQRDPNLPLILLTGSLNEETAVTCMKAGAADYVLKDNMTRLPFAVRETLERKRVRLARVEAEKRGRFQAQLLDGVSESVVATDLEGRIVYWGRGAAKLYGYAAGEVMGQPYRKFAGSIEPVDEETFRREIIALGAWHGEHVQRRRDGTTFWSDTVISLVIDPAGRPAGFIGIDQDITDRKRTEETMRQQLEELRRWQAVVLGREARMIELKKEVNELLARLGEKPRYGNEGDS